MRISLSALFCYCMCIEENKKKPRENSFSMMYLFVMTLIDYCGWAKTF